MTQESEREPLTKFSEATKKRLISLENILIKCEKERITSKDLSNMTGWKDCQIRHDLWLLKKFLSLESTPIDFRGVSNGYKTKELFLAIQMARKGSTGLERDANNVCIVGLGRLGSALLDEDFFEESGFEIKAGFDSNVNRVEILRSTFPLYPAGEMKSVIKKEKISLAVLTVSDKDAQNMANRLCETEIKGIVNMTRCVIKVSNAVKVENLSVINALKMLSK